MSATRTQIYLTQEQREALDERSAREGRSLAELIREAVDAYLAHGDARAVNEVLDRTYGACPDLDVDERESWNRSDRWPDW